MRVVRCIRDGCCWLFWVFFFIAVYHSAEKSLVVLQQRAPVAKVILLQSCMLCYSPALVGMVHTPYGGIVHAMLQSCSSRDGTHALVGMVNTP